MLNPRYSAEKVRSIVQALYIHGGRLTAGEMLYHSQPYNKLSKCWRVPLEEIRFGYKPHLYARLVDNLRVESDRNGHEILKWTEREQGREDKYGNWKVTVKAYEDECVFKTEEAANTRVRLYACPTTAVSCIKGVRARAKRR